VGQLEEVAQAFRRTLPQIDNESMISYGR